MIETHSAPDAHRLPITGPWAVSHADSGFKAMGVNYVVEPIPSIEAGTPAPFVGVQGFMVSAKPPTRCCPDLHRRCHGDRGSADCAVRGRRPSPGAHSQRSRQPRPIPTSRASALSGINGQPQPAIPEMGSVWTAWTDAYSLIFTGGESRPRPSPRPTTRSRALIAEG